MKFTAQGGAVLMPTMGIGQSVNPATVQSMSLQGMDTRTAFSPGSPITPRRPEGESPIQWAYMVGQNIVQQPRANEDIDFATVRSLIDGYDISKLAIQVRIGQIRSMDWHVRPTDMKTYKERLPDIKKVEAFLSKPYSGTLFTDFLAEIERDRLYYDAPCFFKQRTRAGKLGALEPVDGTSITPIIDFYGHAPVPPSPAFIQFVRGVPEVWMTRDSLVYRPFYPTVTSAYGTPPIVNVLMNANTDVRMYLYLLSYFTEGNIPEAFMNMPKDMTDPAKIEEYQKLYDIMMAGNAAQKRRVHMIPAESKVQQMREFKPSTEFTKYMLTITCAAFDVVPSELGFTETTNKSSGDSQENVQMRRSQKPTIRFYNEIFTDIIHNELGFPDLQLELVVNNKDEDQLMDAQRHREMIICGMESPEEAYQSINGHAPTDGLEVGRIFLLGNEIIRVKDVVNGYTGQGQNANVSASASIKPIAPSPSDKQFQKAATAIKKNKFRSDTEERLCRAFGTDLKKALASQVETIAAAAKQHARKLQKADTAPGDMFIELVLSFVGTQDWNKSLTPALRKHIAKVFVASMNEAHNELDTELPEQNGPDGTPLTPHDIFQSAADKYAAARIGDLITGLDDTTRTLIKSALQDAIQQDMTPQEIADSLAANFAFSDSRAMLVARAETADAWNTGALELGMQAGHNAVLVFDGDSDPECAEAAGQVWSIGYAQRHLKQHPRCVRSFSSRYAEPDEIDRGDDDE